MIYLSEATLRYAMPDSCMGYAGSYNFRRYLRFELEHGDKNDKPGSLSAGQLFGYVLNPVPGR